MQEDAAGKKLFAQTTTQKKIVCLEKFSSPPLQKNNGPSLRTSYLITIATDSQQTCVKMCLREIYTAAENGRCKRKSRLGKSQKTMGEGDRGRPTPLPPTSTYLPMRSSVKKGHANAKRGLPVLNSFGGSIHS